MNATDLVPRALESLEDGDIIRRVVAAVLRVAAVVSVVGGFVAVVLVLKFSFRGEAKLAVGGALLALLLLLTTLVNAQILWCRARSVEALGSSPFTVIPIVSVLFRTLGESYAALAACVGLGAALFTVIAGVSPGAVLGPLNGVLPEGSGGGLVGAIVLFITALAMAFTVLLLFYLVAELIVVVADIARNMRLLVAQAMRGQSQPPRA